MRNVPFYPLLVAILVGLGGYLGCDPSSITPPLNPAGNTASSQIQQSASVPKRSADTVIIGSFNIQRLGPSKMKEPAIMSALAQIIQQYDVIALQEITDKSGAAINQLMQYVNQGGGRYSLAMSDPVGRAASGYYEQYAFVYDTSRIEGGQRHCYLVTDPTDQLHREPYVGRFQTRTSTPFTFSLVNIHTDPDDINTELDVLATVLTNVRAFEYQQAQIDDVMLLGDLNAAPGKLRGLERIQGTVSVINIPTNTRRDKIYDNILLDRGLTSEFTGRAGTIDLQTAFGIDEKQALQISDHMPIWAEFYMQRSNVAALSASQPMG